VRARGRLVFSGGHPQPIRAADDSCLPMLVFTLPRMQEVSANSEADRDCGRRFGLSRQSSTRNQQ